MSLSESLYESSEDNGTATVCAVLEDGELERNITVYLSTDDATAIGKRKKKNEDTPFNYLRGCPH